MCLCWVTSRALLQCSEWRGVAPGHPNVLFCVEGHAGEPFWAARKGVAQGYLSKVSGENGRPQGSLCAVGRVEVNGHGEPFWAATGGTHCWGARDNRWVTPRGFG